MQDEILDGIKRLFWNYGERRLRSPWRLSVTFVAFLFAALLFAGVGAIFSGVGPSGPLAATLGQVVLVGGLTVATVMILWVVDRRNLRDIGLGLDRLWLRDLLGGLAIGAGMVVGVVAVLVFAGAASFDGIAVQGEGDLLAGLSVPVALVVGILFFTVLAGLEELLFRGYLLVNVAEGFHGLLGSDRSVLVSAVLSSVCFGFVHAANPGGTALGALNIVLVGGLLAAGYALTGRLALPLGIHTAWNYTVGLVFGLPVSGLTTGVALFDVELSDPAFVSGGAFGPEGGLGALVGLLVGTLLVAAWARRFYDGLAIDESISIPDIR